MSWRRRLFTLGLGIGLLLFLRQVWVSFGAIQQHNVSVVRPVYLLAALGACLLMYVFQMTAWALIMRYVGVTVTPRQTLEGYCLTFLPRYIPGTVWGYWSRSHWLERSHGVAYTVSVTGSILEAAAGLLTALVMAGLTYSTRLAGSRQLLLGLGCAVLLGLAWLVVPKVAIQIGRRLGKEKWVSHPSSHRLFGAWSVAIVLYLGLWTAYGASVLCVGNAFSENPSGDLVGAVFASSLAWVVGFVIVFVPTGIGVRELALSTLLASHSSLLPWQAEVVAVVSRFAIIVAELAWLVVGVVLYSHERRRNRRLGALPPDLAEE